jgi:hypothetical protein
MGASVEDHDALSTGSVILEVDHRAGLIGKSDVGKPFTDHRADRGEIGI